MVSEQAIGPIKYIFTAAKSVCYYRNTGFAGGENMTFKKGIHIEVDEKTYRLIEQEVRQLNTESAKPKMSVSRFVKTLVVDRLTRGGENGQKR